MASPAYNANRVLDALHIVDLNDLKRLEEIAWQRGALVVFEHLSGAEARLVVLKQRAVITISKSVGDRRRRRFSIGHELGHLEMHQPGADLAICTKGDIEHWEARRSGVTREQEANEFASALLLPERFFAQDCQDSDPSLQLIMQLSEKYDVSLTATAIRFVQLCPAPCAVIFSQEGHIKWFEGSTEFASLGAFVDVRVKVDPSTAAARFFRDDAVPSKPRTVQASAWLRPGGYRHDATIQEQSLAMPGYNGVLSLIWMEDDFDGELLDEENDE